MSAPPTSQGPPAGQEMPSFPGSRPQPTPEQIQAMERQLAAEAQKHGMTVPQFVEQLKRQAYEQNMRRMAALQQQQAGAAGAGADAGASGAGGAGSALPPNGLPMPVRMTPNGPVAVRPNGETIPLTRGPDGRMILPGGQSIAPGNSAIRVVEGPDGKRVMMGPNGKPVHMMMGPNGIPIPMQHGPNGEKIPVQMGPNGQLVPMPLDANGNPILPPPPQGSQAGQGSNPQGAPSPQQVQYMQQMMQQQQQQHAVQQRQAGPQPIVPGPPNPAALAVAKFLRGQSLKPRTVILNGERKDMFKVKRALRALQTPAYEKARKKNPILPAITDRASLENAFKLLPMSMLALRVGKSDPHAGHNHGNKKTKRIKGQWTVSIIQQQDAADDMYYVWLWEGSQVMRKVYAALALVLIFLVPNPKKKKSKKSKTAPANAEAHSHMNAAIGHAPAAVAMTTATDTQVNTGSAKTESEGLVERVPYSAPEVKDESD
ncbi:Translocation protein SEC62 [Ceratocystis platani]|uniref:Translocation protein SEC62 n=1 Tax=Ceratocystis fimbriata f. sp. platani TaxID=88771 RepID=A0A0F8B677_CERFI|nr:Translocation protein SEC62 [Ceratocystis platani]